MYNNSHLETLSVSTSSIDKIILSTKDFEIDHRSPISIQPHLFSLGGDTCAKETPLFKSTNGHIVYGKKAFLNEVNFNVSIKNDGGATYANVSFNPNKIHHAYLPCSFEQALDSLELIDSQLKDNGIILDLDTSNILRLDLMKQKYLSDSLYSHHMLLSTLRAKRQHSRTYVDTYVIGNTQHETVFYDKSTESNLPEPNLIRCEIRAKRPKPVSKIFGLETIKDLKSSNVTHLTQRYNQHLYANVFVGATNETRYQTEKEILKRTIEKYGQNGIQKYFMTIGIEQALSAFGSLDNIKKELKELVCKETVNRWRNRISNMYRERASMMEFSISDNSRLLENIYSFAS